MAEGRARRDVASRWRHAVQNLHVWRRGGERAVHKPLLTLWLLGRVAGGGSHVVPYAEIEEPLAALLREFGPPRKQLHPEFPFWHLQTDRIWVVRDAPKLRKKKGGSSPSPTVLREHRAVGEVPQALWHALAGDAALREELAEHLLADFWPESLHESIRTAVGLPEPGVRGRLERPARDPLFRRDVLRAYEYRCAVCGFDGRLAMDSFGLEAAHVRWHCEGGPDAVDNGLALCTFHHHALDRGALGLSEDDRVLVSEEVNGGEVVEAWLLRYAGETLRPPQSGHPRPDGAHRDWHRREVFRGPARRAG